MVELRRFAITCPITERFEPAVDGAYAFFAILIGFRVIGHHTNWFTHLMELVLNYEVEIEY